MKERPIIFNTEMIQAILDDRKSQTRRVIKPQPYQVDYWTVRKEQHYTTAVFYPNTYIAYPKLLKCPYGKIGDRLWVRETWFDYGKEALYKADMDAVQIRDLRFKPSIFMPRKYSRITLEITDIRVERVQDITTENQIAEGIIIPSEWHVNGNKMTRFGTLWDSINAKRGFRWDSNPWVWVLMFNRSHHEEN